MRHLVLTAALALSCVMAAGCGDDSNDDAQAASEEPAASSVQDPNDVDAFCAEMKRLSGERPEEYIGSAEHIGDVEALQAVAPDELRSEVEAYRTFLASGVVDPNDPGSNVSENWPPAVRDAISKIVSVEEERC